jgi:hypothetical protein
MLIAWLAKAVAGTVGERFAKPAAWAIVIVGAGLILWGGWALLKSSIISTHETRRELRQSQADRTADTKVGEMRREDDTRLRQERQQLEGAADHATSDVDRRIAFHQCLELQQRARRERRQPPACVRPPLPRRTAGTEPRANPGGR